MAVKKAAKKAVKKKAASSTKMGRPKKEIDWERLDSMCEIQCTGEEISAILGISKDTLDRAIKAKHGCTFAAYFAEKRSPGKESLRRRQYRAAMDGDKTMLVWLGKQWLGQTDKIQTEEIGNAAVVRLEMPSKRKRGK